jgi:hypothetical protein
VTRFIAPRNRGRRAWLARGRATQRQRAALDKNNNRRNSLLALWLEVPERERGIAQLKSTARSIIASLRPLHGRADRQRPCATPGDWTDKYPSVIAALANVEAKTAYLDGELSRRAAAGA